MEPRSGCRRLKLSGGRTRNMFNQYRCFGRNQSGASPRSYCVFVLNTWIIKAHLAADADHREGGATFCVLSHLTSGSGLWVCVSRDQQHICTRWWCSLPTRKYESSASRRLITASVHLSPPNPSSAPHHQPPPSSTSASITLPVLWHYLLSGLLVVDVLIKLLFTCSCSLVAVDVNWCWTCCVFTDHV